MGWSADCEKKDCVHFELCRFDFVYRFLCGKKKDYYGVVPPQLQFAKIEKKLEEIRRTPSDRLSSIGKELGIERGDLTSEQYRLLLQYKVQEDFRQKEGLQIPKPIREKIEGILLAKKDGLLLKGEEDEEKGGDIMARVKKGSKKAKEKMAQVRAAKGNKGPKVGVIARNAIKAGKGFEETLKLIKAQIPDTRFSKACYAWYKSHLD